MVQYIRLINRNTFMFLIIFILSQSLFANQTIEEGLHNYPIYVNDNVNPQDVHCSVAGTTSWGSYLEMPGNGFTGNPPTTDVMLDFSYPDDVKYYVYSNIHIDNATINILSDFGNILRTQTASLNKGWTEILFEDFYFGGIQNNIDACHAEITATGVAGETYTLNSTNDYIYNAQTDCYENHDIEFCFDNKLLHSGWNWESFPKLERENNDPVLAIPIFENMIPSNFIDFDCVGSDGSLQKINYIWHNADYQLKSTDGEKFQFLPANNRIYIATGTVLSPSTTITLNSGWNWIGYWLPHSQMIDVAFGSNWDKVKKIKSEDWYFDKMENERGITDPEILPSAKLKPLHYGEGYYVYLQEEIPNFQWHLDQSSRSENFEKKEPDNFSYIKKADYEVIDVVDIDPEIQEIGVFENGECVGGVKVDESSEQILVYSDRMNRNESEFTFEIITGRGNKKFSNYEVYDKNSDIFTNNHIISGHQGYSIVKLCKPKNNHSEVNISINHTCFPNPFKPSGRGRGLGTTISFDLPKSGNVEIDIFNIKGQKVKNFKNEFLLKGKHSVVWNGKNNEQNSICSGIYFYQIKTDNGSVTGKILMLK